MAEEKENSINSCNKTQNKEYITCNLENIAVSNILDLETAELRYILDENTKNISQSFNNSAIKLTFHCRDNSYLNKEIETIRKETYCEGENSYDFELSILKSTKTSKDVEEATLHNLLGKIKTKSVVDSIVNCAKEIGRLEYKISKIKRGIEDLFTKKYSKTLSALYMYQDLLAKKDFKILSTSVVDGYTVEIYGRIKEK